MTPVIHCIGDSHASFFSGSNTIQPAWPGQSDDKIRFFKAYRLGAVTAYNLCETDSTSQGREKLFALLKQIPKGSRVLMIFGEIDCRVHLLRQAEKQNKSLEDVSAVCAERYFKVVMEINQDFKTLVWATVPSTPSETSLDPRYPHHGTNLERNRVTKLFNSHLEKLCAAHSIPFISIFDKLVLPSGRTDPKFFADGVHLSQNAMPLAVEALGFKPSISLRLRSEAVTLLFRLNKNLRYRVKRVLGRASKQSDLG